jgi:hypothetical protein
MRWLTCLLFITEMQKLNYSYMYHLWNIKTADYSKTGWYTIAAPPNRLCIQNRVHTYYRIIIVGHFRGVQFSRMASLFSFRGLIFANTCDHAHYTLYNCTYVAGLIFAESRLSTKTAIIGPHEKFPLYGSCCRAAGTYC